LLSTDQVVALTTFQVSGIATDDLQSLSSAQISFGIGTDISAFGTAQVSLLTTAQVVGLSSNQAISLSTVQISAITSPDAAVLTSAALSALSSTQVGSFNSVAVAALSTSQVVSGIGTDLVGFGTAQSPGYYRWNGDPREGKLYIKPDVNPDAGVYQAATFHKGIPYGAISGFAPGFTGSDLSAINAINLTSPNTGLTPAGPASDAWILTSVESLFLQAEARERGIITTGSSAEQRLTDAIRESFVFLGLTATQADTYITNNASYPDVDYNGVPQGPGLPAGGIFTILSQKWFALNGIAPYEVWSDYRRTDVVYGEGGGFDPGPSISILPGAESQLPVRLYYPQSEYSFNEANVQAQGTINVFTNRVFWDMQ
jgi:hypothetical protein